MSSEKIKNLYKYLNVRMILNYFLECNFNK
jgi:hypothetical protein